MRKINDKDTIIIICRMYDHDASAFIKPFIELKKIERIDVYRDSMCINNEKVHYHLPLVSKTNPLRFIFRLLQILRNSNSQVRMIIGLYEIPHGLIAVIAAKLLFKPSIVSMIGNPGYKKLRKGFRLFLTKLILNLATYVTVTGTKSKKILIDYGIKPGKIHVLPNSIDINEFKSNGMTPKRYDIINLGRLSLEKNHFVMLRVIEKLRNEFPNISVAFAGEGPTKKDILEKINLLNLQNNVNLLGYIKQDTVTDFLNEGKVFLLTSETEGFPRTILQAMNCGAVCVASNVGDISDLIKDGENGYLVNNCDAVDEYVKKISVLLHNPDIRERLSEKSKSLIKECYSHEAVTLFWNKLL